MSNSSLQHSPWNSRQLSQDSSQSRGNKQPLGHLCVVEGGGGGAKGLIRQCLTVMQCRRMGGVG